MPEIIPAILADNRETFQMRLRMMEGVAACVQVDCLDGHFAPNRSYHDADALDTSLEIELHLMVTDPFAVIEDWKRIKQTRRVLWHIEIQADHGRLIERCRELGWECGLAVSPETPLQKITPYAALIDEILILGVKPGWSGQALIASTLDKIGEAKKIWPGICIGFDGGATRENLPELISRGAERINLASAIFSNPDPAQTLRDILSTI